MFWILTPLSPLSWVSKSFKQDIGQFHSPRINPCPWADHFVKVNIHIVVHIKQGKSKNFLKFQLGKFLLSKKNLSWKIWLIYVKQWKLVWIHTWGGLGKYNKWHLKYSVVSCCSIRHPSSKGNFLTKIALCPRQGGEIRQFHGVIYKVPSLLRVPLRGWLMIGTWSMAWN